MFLIQRLLHYTNYNEEYKELRPLLDLDYYFILFYYIGLCAMLVYGALLELGAYLCVERCICSR